MFRLSKKVSISWHCPLNQRALVPFWIFLTFVANTGNSSLQPHGHGLSILRIRQIPHKHHMQERGKRAGEGQIRVDRRRGPRSVHVKTKRTAADMAADQMRTLRSGGFAGVPDKPGEVFVPVHVELTQVGHPAGDLFCRGLVCVLCGIVVVNDLVFDDEVWVSNGGLISISTFWQPKLK